jgi:hypothetical protein
MSILDVDVMVFFRIMSSVSVTVLIFLPDDISMIVIERHVVIR